MSIDAGSAVAYLTLDRSSYSAGIKGAYQELTTFLNNSESAGTRVQALGGAMTSVGNMMTKSFTVPIVGAGVMLTKFAMDYETSVAKVASIADTSVVSIDSLSDGIMSLSNETGISASELNNTLYDTISAGVETGKAVDFLAETTKLAKAGFADTGAALDALTSVINAYGLQATDVTKISDLFIETQNKGKLTVGELSSSIGKIIPSANAAGVSIEQLCAGYVELTKNGVAVAESTTYYNSMLNELSKTGSTSDKTLRELTGNGFKGLIQEGKTVADVLKLLDEYAISNNLSLSDMFGSSEAAKAGLILLKNEGNDFNKTLQELGSSAGATDKAFKTVTNTTQEKLTKAINEFKNAGKELGEELLPIATEIIESVTDIAHNFTELDDATKKNIISTGKYLAVTGPLLNATGKLVTTVGSLAKGAGVLNTALGAAGTTGAVTSLSAVMLPLVGTIAAVGAGFYLVNEKNDVLNSSLIKSKEEYSDMEKAMASLMGIQLQSREELERQGIIYKEFNENISEGFKDSVIGMRKEILDFNFTLNEINFDNVFDEEERVALEGRVSSAVDSAIQAVDTKKQEMNSVMADLFATDGIINEEEKNIINWWENRGNKEKEEAKRLQEEISQIEATAFAEGRILTSEEIAAIEERYAQIRQIELLAKTKNNEELLFVQKEFETQVIGMNAEAASELLVEKKKQADDILQQKKTEIEVLKAQTEQGYEEMSEEEKRRVDETKQLYDDAYNNLIAEQDGYFQSSLEFLKDHNKKAYDMINKYNGEVLNNKDLMYYEALVKHKEHYNGIEEITKSGLYRVQNEETGAWETIYAKVDDVTKKVVGVYNWNTQELAAMSKEDAKTLDSEARQFSALLDSVRESLYASSAVYADTEGNIRDNTGKIVGHIKEVEDENGKLVRSIETVNGTPIDLGDNTDTVIQGLKETGQYLKDLDGRQANVSVSDNGTIDYLQSRINSISGRTISVVVKGGMTQMSYATGTDNAMPGVATVAEYGPELIVGAGGRMELATQRSIMPMVGGERVYNARETENILNSMKDRSQSLLGSTSSESIVRQAAEMIVTAIKGLDTNIDRAVRETGNTTNIVGDLGGEIDVDRIPMRELNEAITDYIAGLRL